jgi:hypothetical protein
MRKHLGLTGGVPLAPSLLFVTCLWTLASCGGSPVGPSLDAVVVDIGSAGDRRAALVDSSDDATLCCCQVVGSVTNRNAVPVHVEFQFSAFDGEKTDPIARIFYFIQNLQPSASEPVTATGFLMPCDDIKELKMEVDVRGIVFPPS